jgi:plastocyanin
MEHSDGNNVVMGSFNTSMKGPSNRKAWLILGGIALVVALVIGLIIATMNKGDEPETDSSVPISENVASVNLEITGVTPTTIKVKKGQQATFTNRDTRAHKLTADQTVLPGFDSSQELATGDSYTYIFETSGTYKYYDPADPKGFNGTVVVE